jgi:hypothetical protein
MAALPRAHLTRSMRRMVHRRRLPVWSATVVMIGALCVSVSPASAAVPVSAATAQSWYQSVVADLSPLQSSLIGGLQAVASWQAGHESAAKVGQEIETDLPQLGTALDNVSRLAPLPGYPEAKANFVDGVNLYVQSFSVIRAATQVRSAPLVKQLQRASTRIRELGDTTFDEGTAAIAKLLGSSMTGDDVHAATQIPDWSSVSLAPGAPLVSHWKGTLAQPALTQSAAGWAVAIARSGAPTQASVRHDVGPSHHVSAAQLASLAEASDQAEVVLSRSPGLTGHPQASALVRIALLVDAEAVLAREASELCASTPAAELTQVAGALASVGGSLRGEQ